MRSLLLSLLVCTIVSAACGQDEAALPDSSGRGHSALASGEREQGSGSHPVSPLMLPGEQASRSWVRTALVTSNIPVSIYLIEQLNWGGARRAACPPKRAALADHSRPAGARV